MLSPTWLSPPGSGRACNRTKDHMNPRSSSQSPEGDSRHFLPAVTAPMGWIRARVAHAFVKALAIRR